jgi:hypothetical protein
MSLDPSWTLLVVVLLSGASSAFLLRRFRAKTCTECGHGWTTHRSGGCDSLIGDCAPCGCESFIPAASTRRPVARRESPIAAPKIRKAS